MFNLMVNFTSFPIFFASLVGYLVIFPYLCGMEKVKTYLFTIAFLTFVGSLVTAIVAAYVDNYELSAMAFMLMLFSCPFVLFPIINDLGKSNNR